MRDFIIGVALGTPLVVLILFATHEADVRERDWRASVESRLEALEGR